MDQIACGRFSSIRFISSRNLVSVRGWSRVCLAQARHVRLIARAQQASSCGVLMWGQPPSAVRGAKRRSDRVERNTPFDKAKGKLCPLPLTLI